MMAASSHFYRRRRYYSQTVRPHNCSIRTDRHDRTVVSTILAAIGLRSAAEAMSGAPIAGTYGGRSKKPVGPDTSQPLGTPQNPDDWGISRLCHERQHARRKKVCERALSLGFPPC